MKDRHTPDSITCTCPAGHRVRGSITMKGKQVRCPQCQVEFEFAGPPVDNQTVTDTAVMRILGDAPRMPPPAKPTIVSSRPCPRCGVPIKESASVCKHCNCYVGVLPSFLKQLGGRDSIGHG